MKPSELPRCPTFYLLNESCTIAAVLLLLVSIIARTKPTYCDCVCDHCS